MEEYKIECYIAGENGETDVLAKHFSDKNQYDDWRIKMEENALSEFYNKKIKVKFK